MNNRSIIEIEMNRKYVTLQMGVTDLEAKILREMRRLRNRGHDIMLVKVTETQAVVSPVCKEK